MTATLAKPTLRAYQERVVDAIFSAWDAGIQRPAISMATGGGKSVVFAETIRRHLAHHRNKGPAVVLAHRKELITQAAAHLQRADPDLRIETVIGSPGEFGSTRRAKAVMAWKRADVLVSTVQTLSSRNTMAQFPDPSLVIADESHHAAANSWRNVLEALGCWSTARALGVTATPFREDFRSFEDVWQGIVASVDIAWLMSHGQDADGNEVECAPGRGYLIPPTLRHLTVDGLDLSQVPTSKKSGAVDFREGELEAEMHRAGAFDLVAKTVAAELSGRKGVLFAPTVASSRYLAEVMTTQGVPCHHLDGTAKPADRDRILDEFRRGQVQWLSNVNIVSEGFDLPEIDAVVLARPTQSRIFFRQSIGRALRPAPGKTDAIVLDVVGASEGHSLAGVEALTDADVLAARAGEGLTELLDRSARERQGRYDRIRTHLREARDIQARAERTVEQIVLTDEKVGAGLPGLAGFVERAKPMLAEVQDYTTTAADKALQAAPEQTLDELEAIEESCAKELVAARKSLASTDQLKTLMRTTLSEVKERPSGEVARAMVTGQMGTVAGNPFGEEEERSRPGAPGTVQALKVRGANRDEKPTHPARWGWTLTTRTGCRFCLVHGEGGATAPGQLSRSEPTAIAIAVPVGRSMSGSREQGWVPVWFAFASGQIDELVTGLVDEESASRAVVQYAWESTAATNLLNPAAPWRKKASPVDAPARKVARRWASGVDIPENATAGYVSDVITIGKHAGLVDQIGDHVRKQTADW